MKQERAVSPGMTVSGNLLPPCRICLDKASGFHYGLNTCEACKVSIMTFSRYLRYFIYIYMGGGGGGASCCLCVCSWGGEGGVN